VDYPFGETIKTIITATNKVAILVLVDYPFGVKVIPLHFRKLFVAILVLVDYPFGAGEGVQPLSL